MERIRQYKRENTLLLRDCNRVFFLSLTGKGRFPEIEGT